MLRSDTFWAEERDAPLLKLNYGFLQQQGEPLFVQTSKWLAAAGLDNSSAPVVLADVLKPDRILVADAERTFRSDTNRAQFVKLLSHVVGKFGDYAQGMSFVASFLLLTLSEADVVALLHQLNYTERYLPGYWKAEAIKFSTDAFVFQHLLAKYHPALHAHLQKNGCDATVYCQKYFVGLCVHVLPIEHLFPFFERFLQEGFRFLLKFALSLAHQLEPQILAVQNNPSVIFGLLRLDPKYVPHDEEFGKLVQRIFEGTKDYDLSDIDFTALRQKIYDERLKARVEGAHLQQSKAKDDEDDGIEDCEICLDDFPEVYCTVCKLKICENCHKKPPAKSSHLPTHKVKDLDEEEEEEEEEEEKEEEEKEEKESIDQVTSQLENLSVKP